MDRKRFDKGMRLRKAVLGPAHVKRSWDAAKGDELLQPLQEMVTEIGWGAIWGRPGLERKTRSMINLAMLSALNRPHELEIHMRGAIRNGVSKTEVREILIQVAGYCGFPASIDGFRVAKRVWDEHEAAAKPKPARKSAGRSRKRK
jgi:4-carboxymuconolactone decarboxylase